MRFSIKPFQVRYVLIIDFRPERYIKWLPAIGFAKIGPVKNLRENT